MPFCWLLVAGCQQPLAFLGLQMHHSNICLCFISLSPSYFSVSHISLCLSLMGTLDILRSLFTSAKNLFPDKVTFTRFREFGFRHNFFEAIIQPTTLTLQLF